MYRGTSAHLICHVFSILSYLVHFQPCEVVHLIPVLHFQSPRQIWSFSDQTVLAENGLSRLAFSRSRLLYIIDEFNKNLIVQYF